MYIDYFGSNRLHQYYAGESPWETHRLNANFSKKGILQPEQDTFFSFHLLTSGINFNRSGWIVMRVQCNKNIFHDVYKKLFEAVEVQHSMMLQRNYQLHLQDTFPTLIRLFYFYFKIKKNNNQSFSLLVLGGRKPIFLRGLASTRLINGSHDFFFATGPFVL